MSFEEFILVIENSFQDRFKKDSDNNMVSIIEELASDVVKNKKAFRITRIRSQDSGKFRTILLVGIDEKKNLKESMEWAGLTRDLLLNPELSDLYLFIYFPEELLQSINECLRIEATEEICRKYVIRPNETGEDFIKRTFLMPLIVSDGKTLGADPLLNAFNEVEKNFPWFTDLEKENWKKAFLSGSTGADLIDQIF